MSDRASTRQRLSAGERRERLLSAAATHFGECGYAEASLRDIAALAGVTTPVLYDHFDSKAELYAAVAWQQADSLLAFWSSPATGTVEEVFRATIERIFLWIEANPQGWRILFADVPSDPVLAETLSAVLDRAAAAGAELFAALPVLEHPEQLSRAQTNAAVARLAMNAVNGLAEWCWHHPEVPRATVAALAGDLLWRGLRDLTQVTPNRRRSQT